MLTARRIVEELLDEAILLPVQRWAFKHLAERYAVRLEKIPMPERLEHMRAIEQMIERFRNNRNPITVGDAAWWMPFPKGWRLLGENDQAKTLTCPRKPLRRSGSRTRSSIPATRPIGASKN